MAFTFSGLNFVGDVSAQAVFPPPPSYYLWSWGRNNYGLLGVGDTIDRSSPVQVGALGNWSTVSGGVYHNLSIKTDGTLWAWGRNYLGFLGLGETTARSSPVQVGALTNWSKIATGGGLHSLAITTDGYLWTWGYNGFGQLGLGNTTSISSPVQIGYLTTWSSISAGGNHS